VSRQAKETYQSRRRRTGFSCNSNLVAKRREEGNEAACEKSKKRHFGRLKSMRKAQGSFFNHLFMPQRHVLFGAAKYTTLGKSCGKDLAKASHGSPQFEKQHKTSNKL